MDRRTSNRPVADAEAREYPRLTRFYGLSPEELERMPRPVVKLYLDAIPELIAEEQLLRIQAADFPHAETGDRNRVHRALVRTVGWATAETVDPHREDHIDALRKMGIRVEEVTPDA